jgi:hypothetical protein
VILARVGAHALFALTLKPLWPCGVLLGDSARPSNRPSEFAARGGQVVSAP